MPMKKEWVALLLTVGILAADLLAVNGARKVIPAADYQEKIEASEATERCIRAVRRLKEERGIPINTASDINDTGVIGQDYSQITTTLGNLEAKRTSTNPNMAAVVVDMFHELGLQPGDQVAINCSGSFPALNIAVMCAVDTLELEPVLISSFGASTHGANDPELTWPDMEYALWQQGLLRHKSSWFSIGGMEDVGREMPPEEVETIVNRLQGYGYPWFYDDDLLHNVRARYQLYRDSGDIKCFVNVGGNDASFGDSSVMVHTDGGILTELSEKDQSTGLVQLFLKDGTPVIHLLNIKGIAAEYGLPIDPVPIPEVGGGDIYCQYEYSRPLALLGLLAAGAVLLWGNRKKRDAGIQRGKAG